MSGARRILILCEGTVIPEDAGRMAQALAGEGASVIVRACGESYDALLDEIAAADCVIGWK